MVEVDLVPRETELAAPIFGECLSAWPRYCLRRHICIGTAVSAILHFILLSDALPSWRPFSHASRLKSITNTTVYGSRYREQRRKTFLSGYVGYECPSKFLNEPTRLRSATYLECGNPPRDCGLDCCPMEQLVGR